MRASTVNWFLFRRISRALWFLPALFSAFAILVVVVAYLSPYLLPGQLASDDLPVTVSADAVLTILSIVGSSMLTVAVFSLSTLVNLLSNAAQTGSPRAVPLIIGDRTAQTSISVFVGAFLFSIVGIIGISGEIYSTIGRLILFVASVLVILTVVWALIRWIGQISVVGRVDETIHRLEQVTRDALERLGPGTLFECRPAGSGIKVDHEVCAGEVGFVQHFDREGLQKLAEENDLFIDVAARPGAYVDFGTILARISGPAAERCSKKVREGFILDKQRTFDYDPGFGFSVLAEIARRALSNAVHDPGTAVYVVTVQTRLLAGWTRHCDESQSKPRYDRIAIQPIGPADLLAEGLRPIAMEGAASTDVTLAILRGLKTLVHAPSADLGAAAKALALEIAARSEVSTGPAGDLAAIDAAAAAVTSAGFQFGQELSPTVSPADEQS